MTTYTFTPAAPPTLSVVGSDALFPVNRIFCIGRNYAAHAKEMGDDPTRNPPLYFQKNASDICTSGHFPYPHLSTDVQHEVELVVALQSGGSHIETNAALAHIYGYGVGLDMTRRDLQREAKSKGRPWEVAKAFHRSAPMGALTPATVCGHICTGAITLALDGTEVQRGDLKQMIWSVPEIVAQLSRFVTLSAGDLIMTGTPSGVGPVLRGQSLVAKVAGLSALTVTVE